MALDPARAAVRRAVRQGVALSPGDVVAVACSGGADSLALLTATIFELHKEAGRVVGVTVDHGLQAGSAEHAARVVEQMAALGADETATVRVQVDPGGLGVEAAARHARYAALSQFGISSGISRILLGHTLDDQAESVLLGLARGSGGRSLQGMRQSFSFIDGGPLFSRPLLEITRAQTEAACRAEGIEWWEDPHNEDSRFARARVRHTVMPMLERELGPGIAQALARTADQMRADMEVVDAEGAQAFEQYVVDGAIDIEDMDLSVPHALRTRVVRRAAIQAGAIESELTRDHVLSVLALDHDREGKEIQLPGHVTAYRDGDRIRFRPTVIR